MGAWIEISFCLAINSLSNVAPYMGAWIEIDMYLVCFNSTYVAPYMGAWIEILKNCLEISGTMSLPTWERGLKFCSI